MCLHRISRFIQWITLRVDLHVCTCSGLSLHKRSRLHFRFIQWIALRVDLHVCTCSGLSLHKRSRLHFVRGSRGEAARVAEEAKNHHETVRCSDSDGFSARHSSREYGYCEQFRGFRSGPERHYE